MSNRTLGIVFILLALLSWAGNATVGRMASQADIPPFALNFWRWVVALVVLAPIAAPKLRSQWGRLRDLWRLWTIFGIVTVAGFNAVFYVALQYTTVVQGTLISAVLPILVLLGARIFLHQTIAVHQIAGVLVSIAGVAVIVTRGEAAMLLHLGFNVGDVWMLFAVCLWAAQTILIRFLPRDVDLLAFQVMAFVPGLIVALAFYLHETAGGRPMPLSLQAAISVGYTGLIASILGFTFWNMGVLRVGAKVAGYFGNLYPVFGSTFGIIILGEQFHWYHALGALVIFSGIFLATASRGNSEAEAGTVKPAGSAPPPPR